MIDTNGIDVSDAGQAALKILAEAAKKESAKIAVIARTSSAAPPKDLKNLFHTPGELHAVRAARLMSALEDAGMAPSKLSIVGEADKPTRRARAARRRRAAVGGSRRRASRAGVTSR